jgi:hypothetical protein
MLGRSFRSSAVVVLTSALFISLSVASATTPTPSPTPRPPSATPAPSKTATAAPTLTATFTATLDISSTPDASTGDALGVTAPGPSYTQEDLVVLTGNVQRPNGMVWFGDDQLYIACNGDWTLYKTDSRTGATISYIFGLRNAHAMYAETDSDGELRVYAPDFERNSFVRIMRTGVRTVASGLEGPWGLAYVDPERFVVSNVNGNTVQLINRDIDIAPITILQDLRSPTGIAVEGNYVYVANNGSARRAIEWAVLDESGAAVPQPLVSGVQNVTNIELGPDGNLYFAYSLGSRGVVGRVNPATCRDNGGCDATQVHIVLYTELPAPLAGLTVSDDLRLFVHTIYRPELYWVQLQG